MLAQQGSGNRSRILPRAVLAREIRTGLEPAAILATLQVKYGEEKQDHVLDKAHEACRAMLDPLAAAGYVDIRDRDLHKAATEVADSLRSLSRLLGKAEDDYGNVTPKKTLAVKTARDAYLRTMRDLTTAAGDEADYPLPKANPDNN